MSDIDQQFIEYVVKSLVGKPDAVRVDRRVDEKGVLLELTVDPEDLGRVIGKRGATAQSLRTLLRALGTKNDARYNLKIIDNGDPEHGRSREDRPAPVATPSADDSDSVTQDSSQVDDGTATTVSATDQSTDDAQADAETAVDEPEGHATNENEVADTPEPVTSASEEDQASDRLAQTRRELADLDDLDV
jgi:hypothetical protein